MNTIQLPGIKNPENDDSFRATFLHMADFNDMENTLNKEDNDSKFDNREAGFLIDYIIKTHHVFAKENAVVIYNLAQKVAYRHSHEHEQLKKFNEIAFLFFHDLLNEILKEEQTLFPFIRQIIKEKNYAKRNSNSTSLLLNQKIELQKTEHEKSFNYLKIFREITNDYEIPSDACNHYKSLFEKMKELEQDLTLHFYLEDDILFRYVLAADKQFVQEDKLNERTHKQVQLTITNHDLSDRTTPLK